MNDGLKCSDLSRCMKRFHGGEFAGSRCLALYSATIAVADEELMTQAIRLGQEHGLEYDRFYEIVLQSYLFLGFPRMLIAAEQLHEVLPNTGRNRRKMPSAGNEYESWRENGLQLCRRIYGDAYEPLREKVQPIAPEIFDWMILEGYGKVLSRPGLGPIDRELSIVAFLMLENRPKQLRSHMQGALNVGAPEEQLRAVVEDIGEAAGDGYRAACAVLERLKGLS